MPALLHVRAVHVFVGLLGRSKRWHLRRWTSRQAGAMRWRSRCVRCGGCVCVCWGVGKVRACVGVSWSPTCVHAWQHQAGVSLINAYMACAHSPRTWLGCVRAHKRAPVPLHDLCKAHFSALAAAVLQHAHPCLACMAVAPWCKYCAHLVVCLVAHGGPRWPHQLRLAMHTQAAGPTICGWAHARARTPLWCL